MRFQKFGHACLLVEDAGARVLIDPGAFAPGWEDLRDLTAVLVTHQHFDHLDLDRLPALLDANPDASVHTDQATAGILAEKGLRATSVAAGATFELDGLSVEAIGQDHATIHPDIPIIPNVGFLLGGRFFHPGDALTVPTVPVEILGAPTAAPWLKLWEAIDYVRAVAPRIAIPIHEKAAAAPGMYYQNMSSLAPESTAVEVIDDGEPREY
ncbi:MBL fold metallo-hydrolase [Cryptosporangium phraense]|uniref:MBL fold metallo-hydrolase n=1 Tax=Cryptosporangium phraense TaxID=2593070 RepID=A0A545AKE6_9ACTN|nr:MBL fold metallo-hydrolase [Cryptosporangium phraense]TQS41796.1 MBL fold metallo-hydrolase [Cryptosporangium phraense]